MPGTLYVVATPIGNLEDISLRALRILKSVAVVAAEDTRHTQILLRHYAIPTACVSFHEHNERTRVPTLIARLQAGDDVAIVSDAGTPAIADPGFQLVRAAHEAKIRVEAIPGPSAVLTALVSSGLATNEFTFLGFAPARSKDKKRWVPRVVAEPRTVVFFDSPRRVRDTLARLAEAAPGREVVVARELTKKFETLVKAPIETALEQLGELVRGEVTVVVQGNSPTISALDPGQSPQIRLDDHTSAALLVEFDTMRPETGPSRKAAIKLIAARHGLSSKAVYSAIEAAKKGTGNRPA